MGELGGFSFWASLADLWCQLKTQLGMDGPGWPYSSVWWLAGWWSGGLSWNDLSSSRLAWVPSHVAFGFQRPTREGKPKVYARVNPLLLSNLLLFYWPKQVTWSRPESMWKAPSKFVDTERYITLWVLQQQSTRPSQHENSVQSLSLLFPCFTEKSPQYNSA